MSLITRLSLSVALGALVATAAQADPGPLLGFSSEHALAEKKLEARFDASISPDEMKGWMKRLASEPNNVGSPHDHANAEFLLSKYREFGFDARIETFEVLYPTPLSEKLELLGPKPFRAALHEPAIPEDSTSSQTDKALPPYVAYQGDGDVTGDLVYVNYGMPEDYLALERLGISVKGKIVIARYGKGWRGLKPQLAEEHGAIGALIYSDPADDGYGQGDSYPKGALRPADGVQRGSVQKMMIYPGDPLTPGVGATKDAKRLTRETATTLLHIPALPISYADAKPFLEAMGGPLAPEDFRGGLPIAYHVGGVDAVKAHLAVKSDWGLKTIYDVIAVLKGKTEPDQWIVRGNHHDGWVFGASDPLSGNVAMLEEAKAVGELAKSGWRPARTIVYASWDAEEPGLIGSTEWAETHAVELQAKAVAYVNSDSNDRGFLGVEGSHALQTLVNQVSEDVSDPEKGVSVGARERANLEIEAMNPRARESTKKLGEIAASGAEIPLSPLGSGSDYSSFLQHLGIASLNIAYEGEGSSGGVYHSLYDSYDHFIRFSDPDFVYEAALTKTAGRVVLRLADADIEPMRFAPVAKAAAVYLAEVKTLSSHQAEEEKKLAGLTSAHAFELASDPRSPVSPPRTLIKAQTLDFTSLEAAVQRLNAAASAFDSSYASAVGTLSPDKTAKLDKMLSGMEQALTAPEGLPGRPWFRHMLYAPGVLTGYGAKTLPGVREAIEGRRYDEARAYIAITARTLAAYADRLDQARILLN